MSMPTVRSASTEETLRCAARTDIGMRREENQDSHGIFSIDGSQVFIVADGMGGVKGGAVASQLAVRVVRECLMERGSISVEEFAMAAAQANAAIFDHGIEHPELAGMGTTLVGLCFQGNDLIIINVGDSRAYRIRNHEIEQLTEDHTLVTELLRSGAISEDQVENHPVAHMLTRSLGPTPAVDIDCWLCESAPVPGDRYLLCSDGLYNMISAREMCAIVDEFEPEQAVEKLIELANMRGGNDNITVILIKAEEPPLCVENDGSVESTVAGIPFSFGAADTLELKHPHGIAVEEEPEKEPPTLDDAEPVEEEAVEKQNAETPGSSSPEIKSSISLNNEYLLERERQARALREAAAAQQQEEPAAEERQEEESGPENEDEDEAEAEVPQESDASASSAPAPAGIGLGRSLKMLCIVAVFSVVLGYAVGTSYRSDFGRSGSQSAMNQSSAEPIESRAPAQAAATPIFEPPQSQVQPSAADTVQPAAADSVPAEAVPAADPEDRPPGDELRDIDFKKISQAKERLRSQIAELDEKIASFEKPLTGAAERMLTEGRAQLSELQRQLEKLQEEKQIAENKNKLWVGRSRRLTPDTVIGLAQDIAPVAPKVNEIWEDYLTVFHRWRREDEVSSYNPEDEQQRAKVTALWKQLVKKRAETAAIVRETIDLKKRQAGEAIAEITLRQDELQRKLARQEQDLEYAKVLFSSDPSMRNQVKQKLIDQRASLEMQFQEYLRLLPDSEAEESEAVTP